jgi:uncharacterized membrane protein YkoI
MRFLRIVVAVAALAAPQTTPAHSDHDHDHDEAREAVNRAEIRKLAEILSAVKEKLPGEIVGVEIEHKHGVWYYEFRTVDGTGRIFEVYVNAKTAEIAKVKEK